MDDNNKHPIDEKKVKFKRNIITGTRKGNAVWIVAITIVSFFASAVLSVVASSVLRNVDIFVAFLVVMLIILVNIASDIIGTAVTAADETPFHAMASRKMYGARQSIMLIRNADKVSNLCNDVIGDICGVISGTAGAYIIVRLIGNSEEITIIALTISGCIAAFTVGGKALGKTLAIRNSNFIVYRVSVIIQFIITRFRTDGKKRKNRK